MYEWSKHISYVTCLLSEVFHKANRDVAEYPLDRDSNVLLSYYVPIILRDSLQAEWGSVM